MAQLDVELAAAKRGTKAAACRYALLKLGYPNHDPSLDEVKVALKTAQLTRACPFVDNQLEAGLVRARHALDKRGTEFADSVVRRDSVYASEDHTKPSASLAEPETYAVTTDTGTQPNTEEPAPTSVETTTQRLQASAESIESAEGTAPVAAALATKEAEIMSQIASLQEDLATIRKTLALLQD